MIRLYEATDTSWTTAGLRLTPQSCKVHEQAGGTYECTMTLPITEGGAHMAIACGKILRVPVPPAHIPEISLGEVTWWQVDTQTDLLSRLPSSRRVTYQAWVGGRAYTAGDKVTSGGHNYQCTRSHGGIFDPPPAGGVWSTISDYEYISGTVIQTLTVGTLMVRLSGFNSVYMYVRTAGGLVGYIKIEDCSSTGTTEDDVIPARDITEQSFRVDKVTLDMANATATVHAVHISYDMASKPLYECNVVECPPYMAMIFLKSQMTSDWPGIMATNIHTGTVTADWSWQTPVEALLSPDTGFAPQLKARVLRDDFDVICIPDTEDAPALRLKYGVNLTGLKWVEDTKDYVTRIYPRGQKKDGSTLMLSNPDYVETSLPHSITVAEILDVGCKVGETIEKTDGTKQTLTEADCLQMLQDEAQKRFTDDHCDRIKLTYDCQFVMLGDTADHPELAGLQQLRMYDTVRCTHPVLGVDASAQVCDYTWDAILCRFESIKLGDVFDFGGRSVAGWDLGKGALIYDKLHNNVPRRIRAGLATEEDLASTDATARSAGNTARAAANDIEEMVRQLKNNYDIDINL